MGENTNIMTKAEQNKIDKMNKDNGKLFVIAVGISDYDNKADNLNNCCTDAKSIHDTFKTKEYFNMDSSSILVTSDVERTSKSALIDRINACNNFIDDNTNIIFYYSGHGCNIDDQFHFWVSDSNTTNNNTISIKELTDILTNLNGGHHKSITILVDACQQTIRHHKGLESYSDKFIREYIKSASGLGIIYSCSKGEYSLDEFNGQKISVFTYLILQALNGNSSALDVNLLTFSSLYNFLQLESRKTSREYIQINQHPIATFDGNAIVYSYIPAEYIHDGNIKIEAETYNAIFESEMAYLQNTSGLLYIEKCLSVKHNNKCYSPAPYIPFISEVCEELKEHNYLNLMDIEDIFARATTYLTLIDMDSSDTLKPALKKEIIDDISTLNDILDDIYEN